MISRQLATCYLILYYSHIFQSCFIILKLSYLLFVSPLSNSQLESINNIVNPNVISSKGFNGYWPKSLRYGEHKFSGLEMLDSKVEQRVLTKHILRTYSFFTQSIRLLCMRSSNNSIFPQDFRVKSYENPKNTNYINSIWLNVLLRFMGSCNIKIITKEYFSVKNKEKMIDA